jgi:hypothetical protein
MENNKEEKIVQVLVDGQITLSDNLCISKKSKRFYEMALKLG